MSADVDIDLADRDQILALIKYTPARQVVDGKIRKHNSGVYATSIPVDPINECASIDYKEADARGYFKIDLLNMHVYKLVKDHNHYTEMLKREPTWSKLLDKEFCEKVVHVANHYDLLCKLKPDSIPRMAMFLALIRPAKRHLADKSWAEIAKEIWQAPEDDSYFFKKSHAVGYAHLVALHMNLLETSHGHDEKPQTG